MCFFFSRSELTQLLIEIMVASLNHFKNILTAFQYILQAGEEILTLAGDRLGLLNEEDHMCIQWKADNSEQYRVRLTQFTQLPQVNETVTFQKVLFPQALGIAVLIEPSE